MKTWECKLSKQELYIVYIRFANSTGGGVKVRVGVRERERSKEDQRHY